ncbi:uncharacterized protein LOC121367520 [Gigantopelta aegis]|uniref:uncharacterized protein LOC121367520 n=1 Tax=Gigantopelta aegis TaxID=1735272 RepID=UPI001B88A445|nr:uncharacterized protein LOC121367520 [Gigantopelta aegis]
MKLAVILLCVALMGGANASFGDFLHSIGNALKPIVGILDTTVASVLKNAVNTGKNLLGQTLQALLLNVGSAVQKQRDLSALFHMIPAVESTVHGILDRGHSLFSSILNKLTTGLTNVIDKVSHFDISPEAVVEKIDQLVGSHNLLVDGILGHVVSSIEGALSSHKRNAFTDILGGFATSIKNFFQPHIDAIKNLATTAGSLIKNAATGILAAGKESFTQLAGKLSEHLNTLKGVGSQLLQHGVNALSALKAASTDILQQTVANMKEPIQTAKETLASAGGTILQHVAQAVSGK